MTVSSKNINMTLWQTKAIGSPISSCHWSMFDQEHQNQGMAFFICPLVFSQFLEIKDAETSWLKCCSGLLCSIALSWHCVADKKAVIDAHLVLCEASLVLPFLPPPAPSLNPGLVSEAIKQHFPEILICEEQINSLIVTKLFAESHYKWFILLQH